MDIQRLRNNIAGAMRLARRELRKPSKSGGAWYWQQCIRLNDLLEMANDPDVRRRGLKQNKNYPTS